MWGIFSENILNRFTMETTVLSKHIDNIKKIVVNYILEECKGIEFYELVNVLTYAIVPLFAKCGYSDNAEENLECYIQEVLQNEEVKKTIIALANWVFKRNKEKQWRNDYV